MGSILIKNCILFGEFGEFELMILNDYVETKNRKGDRFFFVGKVFGGKENKGKGKGKLRRIKREREEKRNKRIE